jgi:hypothetical protein
MVLQNSVHMFLTLLVNCVLTGLVKQTVHVTNVQVRDNYGWFSHCILRVATKNPCKCRLSNAHGVTRFGVFAMIINIY